MSGSSVFRLELTESFARSVENFLSENYSKKEKKGREEATGALQAHFDRLLEWPSITGKCGDAATKAGWVLQKIEFRCPRLSGEASCGRLIYLVHKDDRKIIPIVVYTHKQFTGRVPDKSLSELIAAVLEAQEEAERQEKAGRPKEAEPQPIAAVTSSKPEA